MSMIYKFFAAFFRLFLPKTPPIDDVPILNEGPPPFIPPVPVPVPVVVVSLMEKAWDSGMLDVGKGGDKGTNNVSAYILGLRKECGFPLTEINSEGKEVPADGSWCAVGISAHLIRNDIPIKSRGAYRLAETMVAHELGFEVEDLPNAPDGVYIGVWKRKGWDRKGLAHIRFIKKTGDNLALLEFNGPGDRVFYTPTVEWGDLTKDLLIVAGWSQ